MSDQQSDYSDAHRHPPEAGRSGVWMRLVYMIIFAVLFGLAETLLLLMAVLQFGWLLFAGKRNSAVADFGLDLAEWMRQVARFQTMVSEQKPFPWNRD